MMNTNRIKLLKEIANQAFNLNVDHRSRKAEYIAARAICYKILKEECDMTYSYIGRAFNKNHATVLHAIDEFPWMVKADKEMEKTYRKILERWLNKSSEFTDTNPTVLKKDVQKLEERNNLLNLALLEVQDQVDKLTKDNKRYLDLVKKLEKTLPEERLNKIEKKLHNIINGIF
jgi:septal ring factor EnvC (AmiA/AmiB activator)